MSKGSKKQNKSRENEQTLYLVIRSGPKHRFIRVANSLDEAKNDSIPDETLDKEKEAARAEQKTTFSSLQKEITRAVGTHRALDELMSLLDHTKLELQFG